MTASKRKTPVKLTGSKAKDFLATKKSNEKRADRYVSKYYSNKKTDSVK